MKKSKLRYWSIATVLTITAPMLLADSSIPPQPVIIDNSDSANTSTEGSIANWRPNKSVPGYTGKNFIHDRNRNKGRMVFQFRAPISIPGSYAISFSAIMHRNRAATIPVTVTDSLGKHNLNINEKLTEGAARQTWIDLGTYQYAAGNTAIISVSNEGTVGFVAVDAVQVVMVTPTPTPAPTLSPKPTPTPTPTLSPKPTPTPTPTLSPKPTPTPTPTLSPKPTPTPTPTLSPKPTPTPTPTLSPKPTPTPTSTPTPPEQIALPLSVQGSQIVDANGSSVQLRCVNWASHMETMLPEGIQFHSLDYIIGLIKSTNLFNCVRFNYAANAIVSSYSSTGRTTLTQAGLANTKPTGSSLTNAQAIDHHNPGLLDSPLSVIYDTVIQKLADQKILILLDNHVTVPKWCCTTGDGNGYFNESKFDTATWLTSLSTLAKRYINQPYVALMDLRNELRSSLSYSSQVQLWNQYVPQGISAINESNPNVLILVSGLSYASDLTFIPSLLKEGGPWAEQYAALADKIVIEAHFYSGWYGTVPPPNGDCSKISSGLASKIVTPTKGRPLIISEFGMNVTSYPNSEKDVAYLQCLTQFVNKNKASWGLWVLPGRYFIRSGTPNYGESWGILTGGFSKIANPAYISALLEAKWK